jgi:hypothetical protein
MSSGGKKPAAGQAARDYYASFAGVICHGVVDELVSVVIDGKTAWSPAITVKHSQSANPYVFDVYGWGRIYFYWGRSDQIISDPVLTKAGRDHPNYRGKCVAVFYKFLCGRERTSVPDVSFIVRKAPQQFVPGLTYRYVDAEGQANPLTSLAYALTNKVHGAGLSPDIIDAPSWEAMATQMVGSSWREYLTMCVTSKTNVRDLFSMFNGYLDSFFRFNTAGKIEVGRFPQQYDPAGMPTLTRADLIFGQEPQYAVNMLADMKGRVNLKFSNRYRAFEEDVAVYVDGPRRDIIGNDTPIEVDRKWIKRPAQAALLATHIGRREAMNHYKFSLSCREEKVRNLFPGDRVIFYDELWGMNFVGRIIERVGDGEMDTDVELMLHTERWTGNMAGLGQSDLDSIDDDEVFKGVDFWFCFQASTALAGLPDQICFIAGRTQLMAVGALAYFRKAGTEFQLLGSQRSWAFPMQIWKDYPSSVAVYDNSWSLKLKDATPAVTAGAPFLGFDEIDMNPSADEIADDAWLLIAVDWYGRHEIMTLRAMRAYSESYPAQFGYPARTAYGWELQVTRARFGTPRRAFRDQDRPLILLPRNEKMYVYIIPRQELEFFGHLSIPSIANAGSTAGRTIETKLVGYSYNQQEDFTTAPARSLELS